MGMLSHAAVVRNDGEVFVHLHPAGSINLAAQTQFEQVEGARAAQGGMQAGMHGAGAAPPSGTVNFPFVFPKPGSYRVFVQVKVAGSVETAAFDVAVASRS